MLLSSGAMATILPAAAQETAQDEDLEGPYYGNGNLPPGCTTESTTVTNSLGSPVPRFSDDCYHMRTDLNNLDSAKIDVLLAPPVSPYPERDLRVMRQSIEMWRDGIDFLARDMGMDWLADGVEINIFPGHTDDDVSTDPLWFPKIVVVSTNPVGGAGIGIDPLDFFFGTTGPCHGQPNPLGSFAQWEELPGFENHHGGLSGTYATECDDGGSVCFAVNGAIDPVPGSQNPIFGLYDLVSHEVGHCLSIGHVGDAEDHRANAVPFPDIMSYTSQPHRKCVSSLDVEAFALRMSEFLLHTPLEANHRTGPGGSFQIQHPAEHQYASDTGLPEDCPQPNDGPLPGDRVDFTPERDDQPEGDPRVRILSPAEGEETPPTTITVEGDVDRDPDADDFTAVLSGPQDVARDSAARYTLTATGGLSSDGYTCDITATGTHTLDPVPDTDGCEVEITWSEEGSFTVSGTADDGETTAADSLQVEVTDPDGIPDPNGEMEGGITIFPDGSPLAYNEVLALATTEAGDPAPKFLPGTAVTMNSRFTTDSTGAAGPTQSGEPAILDLPFTWHIWTADGELFDTVSCRTVQDGSATNPQNGFDCPGGYTMPDRLGRYFTTLQYDDDGRWVCHNGQPIFGAVPPQGVPDCLKAFDVVARDDALPDTGAGLSAELDGPSTVATDSAARYTLSASGGQSAGGYTCDITATGTHTRNVVPGTNGCEVDFTWSQEESVTVTGVADDGAETSSDSLDVSVSDATGVPAPNGEIEGGMTIFPTSFPLAYNEAVAFGTAEAGDPAPKFLPETSVEMHTRFTKDSTGEAGPIQTGDPAQTGLPFTWHVWDSQGSLVDTIPCTTVQDGSATNPVDGFDCIADWTMPAEIGRYYTTLQYDDDGRWACHNGQAIFGVVPPQGIPDCLKAFDVLANDEILAAEGWAVMEEDMATIPLILGDTAVPKLDDDPDFLEVRMELEGLADPMLTFDGMPVSYQVDFELDHNWDGPPDGTLPYRLTFDWDAVAGDTFNLFVLSAPDSDNIRTLCPVATDLSQSHFNEDTWEVTWRVPLGAFLHDNHPARQALASACDAFTEQGRPLQGCDTVTSIVGTVSTKVPLFSIGGLGETNPAPDYTLTCGEDPLSADAGGPYEGTVDGSIPLNGGFAGGDGAATCQWSTSDDGAFLDETSCVTSVSFPTTGTKTVTLTATDSTGSASDDATVTVTDDPVAGERVELRVEGALQRTVPLQTGENDPTAAFSDQVDLTGHTGATTITASWFDEDGTLLDTHEVTVEVVIDPDASIEIDAPIEGAEVPHEFLAEGRAQITQGGGSSSTAFVGPDGGPLTDAPQVPPLDEVHDELADESGFMGLAPMQDGTLTVTAYFQGVPPADLPHHLMPEGWTLVTSRPDWQDISLDLEAPGAGNDPLVPVQALPEHELYGTIADLSIPAATLADMIVEDLDGNGATDFLDLFVQQAVQTGHEDQAVEVLAWWTTPPTQDDVQTFMGATGAYDAQAMEYIDAIFASVPSGNALDALALDGLELLVWEPRIQALQADADIPFEQHNDIVAADAAHAAGFTGEGTVVAILDTGVRCTHPAFQWKTDGTALNGCGEKIIDSRSYVTGESAFQDLHGHGTRVASVTGGFQPGVYAGVAPDAKIIDLQVLDREGSGTIASFQSAVQYIIQNEETIDVASMSAGLGVLGLVTLNGGDLDLLGWDRVAAQVPQQAGVPFTIAAGNWIGTGVEITDVSQAPPVGTNGVNQVSSPAFHPDVIAVGSVTRFGVHAGHSAVGPGPSDSIIKPDVTAMGYAVRGAALGGGYNTASGTSFAAPGAAGVLALMYGKNAGLDHLQAKQILQDGARPGFWTALELVPTAVDDIDFRYGHGVSQADASLALVQSGVPGAPRDLMASPGDQQVELDWTPPASDGGEPIQEYTVKWGTQSGGPYPDTMTTTATSETVTGLDNGVQYHFVVSATNAIGEGPDSEQVSATPSDGTTAPEAPRNLAASPGDTQVDLLWDAPASDGGEPIQEYTVKWGTQAGGPYPETMTTTATSETVTGLDNGIQYHFVVSATNAIGEGPDSDEVDATPVEPPEPEGTVQVRILSGTSTLVDWTDADDYDGADWSHTFNSVPAGDATLQARVVQDDEVLASDQVGITILEPVIASITIQEQDLVRSADTTETIPYTVSAQDNEGRPFDLDSAQDVSWSIDPAGGSFTDNVLTPGTTAATYTITATLVDDPDVQDDTTFTIEPGEAASVTIDQRDVSQSVDDTQPVTYTASAQDAWGNPVGVDSATDLTWSIDDPAGGSFQANEFTPGTTKGEYTISAGLQDDPGVTDSTTFTLTAFTNLQTDESFFDLQQAVDAAGADETIVVVQGVYDESVEIPASATGLSLCPADTTRTGCDTSGDPGTVVFEGDGTRIHVAGTSGVRLSGFTFRGDAMGLVTADGATGLTVDGNRFDVAIGGAGAVVTGTMVEFSGNLYTGVDSGEEGIGVLLAGGQDLFVVGEETTGIRHAVALATDDAGGQPGGVLVQQSDFLDARYGLWFQSDTSGVHVDARNNEWGVSPLLAGLKIRDEGSGNSWQT